MKWQMDTVFPTKLSLELVLMLGSWNAKSQEHFCWLLARVDKKRGDLSTRLRYNKFYDLIKLIVIPVWASKPLVIVLLHGYWAFPCLCALPP